MKNTKTEVLYERASEHAGTLVSMHIEYVMLQDLHDSLQHFLWVGVEQSVNIMATSGSDFLCEHRNKEFIRPHPYFPIILTEEQN